MKRLTFWAITTAAMLASCNNHDRSEQDVLPSDRNAITFLVSDQPLTRYEAESADISSLTRKGRGFSVTAVTGEERIIDDAKFFANESCECEADDGMTYYWPTDGSEVSFYAYYPSEQHNDDVRQCSLDVDYGTLRMNPNGETDIMAAHYEGDVLTNDGNVFFNFKHLLSQVAINVSCDRSGLPPYTEFVLNNLSIVAPASSIYDFNTGQVVVEGEEREYSFIKESISVYDYPEHIGTAMIPASSPIVVDGSNKKQSSCTVIIEGTIIGSSYTKPCETSFTFDLAAGYKSTINIVFSWNNVIATSSFVTVEEWSEDEVYYWDN